MLLQTTEVRQILTRSGGYLSTVSSHSLQPYRGCALGNSLCGVGCYVRHSWYVTRGREWGSFVETRSNAVESYARQYPRERAWARRERGRFGIFLSSATEPFQPIERTARITHDLLVAMLEHPPDLLIVQSHSHHVADYLDLYADLTRRCELRFHVSIECDRDCLTDELPPSASSVAKRIDAAGRLRAAGLRTTVTVAPLLPVADPIAFFRTLGDVADAVVIDHYIGGDGTPTGSRTQRTPLPVAMEQVLPGSTSLGYRDRIVAIARRHFPGDVGVGIDGFAGRMLSAGEGPNPARDAVSRPGALRV
ncbi:MAG: hypothetical protein ACREIT_00830 [Tepidisphaeraceae bacterium]